LSTDSHIKTELTHKKKAHFLGPMVVVSSRQKEVLTILVGLNGNHLQELQYEHVSIIPITWQGSQPHSSYLFDGMKLR